MVAGKSDADPVETIMRWADELTQMTESGTWILDAAFPEELGIAYEWQPALFIFALGHFISGGKVPAELKKLPASDLALLREALMGSSWRPLLVPLSLKRAKASPSPSHSPSKGKGSGVKKSVRSKPRR
jgi:hypothetical protein